MSQAEERESNQDWEALTDLVEGELDVHYFRVTMRASRWKERWSDIAKKKTKKRTKSSPGKEAAPKEAEVDLARERASTSQDSDFQRDNPKWFYPAVTRAIKEQLHELEEQENQEALDWDIAKLQEIIPTLATQPMEGRNPAVRKWRRPIN